MWIHMMCLSRGIAGLFFNFSKNLGSVFDMIDLPITV